MAPRARWMKERPTDAETVLWEQLRRGRLGVRFRRQVVIGRFIVDFLCVSRRLIIEVDGAAHDARRVVDEERDRTLAALRWRILRVRNEDVLTDLDAVLGRIVNDLEA